MWKRYIITYIGNCYDTDNGPKCTCEPGWTGDRCEDVFCETFGCKNGLFGIK